jgi:hypothetical protein
MECLLDRDKSIIHFLISFTVVLSLPVNIFNFSSRFLPGQSKKMAKSGAARSALAALHGAHFSPTNGDCLPGRRSAPVRTSNVNFTEDVKEDEFISFDDPVGGLGQPEPYPFPKISKELAVPQSFADKIAE